MHIKSVGIPASTGAWEAALLAAIRGLRYGSVEVVVHDGRVVPIETRERVRFPDPRPPEDRRRREEKDARTDRTTGGTVAIRHTQETDP